MDISRGLQAFKCNMDRLLAAKKSELSNEFEELRGSVTAYVAQMGSSMDPLKLSGGDDDAKPIAPTRTSQPEGFLFANEQFFDFDRGKSFDFPRIHRFVDVAATAIPEDSRYSYLLFNFALMAISSYPIGDSNVFMMDCNVGGDFNYLSPISTQIDEVSIEKNNFHYITDFAEMSRVIDSLKVTWDRNIRNLPADCPDLFRYNKQNPEMFQAFNFIFIRNINETISNAASIMKLCQMVKSMNATRAGIYIFYTYNSAKIAASDSNRSYDNVDAIKEVLKRSCRIDDTPLCKRHSTITLRPKANARVVERILEFVRTAEPPKVDMSFRDEIMKTLEQRSLWNPPAKDRKKHLLFPVGFVNATTKMMVDVPFNAAPHIYVAGKTGSGKSILLHNFILNGALRYSPNQLRFFLVDMKGGVSFMTYRNLPHVSALCASSSRHYAQSLLEMLCSEIDNRARIFTAAGENVSSLDDYNEYASQRNLPLMPHYFCIIDEFQRLFTNHDSISRKAEKHISFIHEQGRSYGIFLALCTQSASGDVSREQVGIRLALRCNERVSQSIIGNEGAANLRGIGRAVLNNSESGDARFNQEFQVANISEKDDLPFYVRTINEIWLEQNNGTDPLSHMVYYDNDQSSKITDNQSLLSLGFNSSDYLKTVYLGKPCFYRKEHVKFFFHRDSQSNVIVVGNDRPAALRLFGIVEHQFRRQYGMHKTLVYISDLQRQTEPTFGKLDFLADMDGISVTHSAELKDTIDEVYQLLTIRKSDRSASVNAPEVLFAIADIKPDDTLNPSSGPSFSFSHSAEKTSLAMLKEVVCDGPALGIHTMLYGYNMDSISRFFDRELLSMFEIKIGLYGGNSSLLFTFQANTELVGKWGRAFVRMPENMGMKYVNEDVQGDPFIVYNTVGDTYVEDSVWNCLFNNLPNREY